MKKLLLFVALFILTERFCHKQTEGFRLNKIASHLEPRVEWRAEAPSPFVKEQLKQSYRFLGSGGQCYAFLSEDGKSVLKFFKHHHMRPLPFRIQEVARSARLESFFSSLKIAHDHLHEETGLLFLQLNPGNHFEKPLTLIDPIGNAHTVDLNQVTFALQKRAELFVPTLKKQLLEGNIEEFKQSVCSLLDLIVERTSKQVADCDPILKRNMGLLNGKALQIDLGSFTLDPGLKDPLSKKRTLFFETRKMRQLIKKRAPELLPFFDLQLERRFAMLGQYVEE